MTLEERVEWSPKHIIPWKTVCWQDTCAVTTNRDELAHGETAYFGAAV